MVLATQALQIVAADIERIVQHRRAAERLAMAAHGLLADLGQSGALDGGGGAGEIAVDEFARQAHRVEDLRAAVRLVGGDAHLGHHLEDALVDRLDVALDGLLLGDHLGQVAAHGVQRLEGEVGVDRLGAVAGQHAEMMHLARLAGLHDQTDRGPQPGADEVMVDAGGGEQRRESAMRSGPTLRSDRMMMLMPALTAASASAHSTSSAVAMPSTPASAA